MIFVHPTAQYRARDDEDLYVFHGKRMSWESMQRERRRSKSRNTGLKAYVIGEEPRRMVSMKSEEGKTQGIFVPPDLPKEFDEAACQRGFLVDPEDAERFFADGGHGRHQWSKTADEARDELWDKYCGQCPILQPCFKWAMAYEEFGIWAGSTPHDRWAIRKDPELKEFAQNRIDAGFKPALPQAVPNAPEPPKKATCVRGHNNWGVTTAKAPRKKNYCKTCHSDREKRRRAKK